MDDVLAMLRAAADHTRLRLLLILKEAELTVTELTQVVGQSQPRVSRHLKLLCDAGLLQRFKEGSWVFYRSAETGRGARLEGLLSEFLAGDGGILEADRRRLAQVREARAAEAAAFFKANAADWERIRSLHAPEKDVEESIIKCLRDAPVDSLLDVGTGTGRMLELLARDIRHGVGIDSSPEMLAIARDRLARAHIQHCQVRLGDVFRLPFASGASDSGFDAALFHQVLHYLDDPQAAIAEAARTLKPGGRILIIDFAPHDLEFLRTELQHRRLGFSDREVQGWFESLGLRPMDSHAIAPHHGGGKLIVKIWVASTALHHHRKKEAA